MVVDEHCELQSKENMLFSATAIANGSGVAVVNSIGMATEIGKIQSQIQEAAKEEDDTPLKKKLDEFGEALAKVTSSLWLHETLSNKQIGQAPLTIVYSSMQPTCSQCPPCISHVLWSYAIGRTCSLQRFWCQCQP